MKKRLFLVIGSLIIASLLLIGCSKTTYTLTIATNGQGTTNPGTGTYTYEKGKSLTITVTPDSGWKFDGWTGDASGSNASISITMDGKKGITANFSKITYPLTLAVNGNGTTNPAPGLLTYDAGSVVNITATPASGWKFDGWTGDVSGSNTSVAISLDRAKSVIANFSKITYILTMAVSGTGITSPTVGGHAYDAGSVVTISASPGSGSQFDGWNGNVASASSQTTTVTINQDKTITANFSKTPIVFPPSSRNIGTGSGSWPISLSTGDRVEFNFTVAGSDVTYSVIDPSSNIILRSSQKGQSGRGSFTATASGNYQLNFISAGIVTPSVMTVSYTIYPNPTTSR